MLEFIILGSFAVVLLICIVLDYSILYALLLGYFIFCIYGFAMKFSPVQLLRMSWKGISTVKNILLIFLLIGMITAVWRA